MKIGRNFLMAVIACAGLSFAEDWDAPDASARVPLTIHTGFHPRKVSTAASTLVMFIGLGKLGLLSWPLALVSAAGVVPVALGIWLGGRIRRRLTEAGFRRAVLVALVVIGASLMLRTWLG